MEEVTKSPSILNMLTMAKNSLEESLFLNSLVLSLPRNSYLMHQVMTNVNAGIAEFLPKIYIGFALETNCVDSFLSGRSFVNLPEDIYNFNLYVKLPPCGFQGDFPLNFDDYWNVEINVKPYKGEYLEILRGLDSKIKNPSKLDYSIDVVVSTRDDLKKRLAS